jgi:hypothetical protein
MGENPEGVKPLSVSSQRNVSHGRTDQSQAGLGIAQNEGSRYSQAEGGGHEAEAEKHQGRQHLIRESGEGIPDFQKREEPDRHSDRNQSDQGKLPVQKSDGQQNRVAGCHKLFSRFVAAATNQQSDF